MGRLEAPQPRPKRAYFSQDTPWLADFKTELLSFSVGRYDDQVVPSASSSSGSPAGDGASAIARNSRSGMCPAPATGGCRQAAYPLHLVRAELSGLNSKEALLARYAGHLRS